MTDKETKQEDLNLSDEQKHVAEALVFSGVNYERQRLLNILNPHKGQEKSIAVDVMIDVINNVPPQEQPQQESEQESQESGE